MTSSESEEHAQQSRKRSRRSNSGENGAGKKTRGRPRVDTQDATAADRRRTQIRLAQRAYRQRKETTIASLQKQNTQLHSIIEQMNTTFHRLAESTVKSGLLQLNPDLAQEFRVVKETFSGLAKAATETQRQVDEDGEQGAEGTGPPKPSEPEPEPEPQHIGWGYSAVAQLPDKGHSQQNFSIPESYSSHFSTTGNQSVPSIISHHEYTFGDQMDQTHHISQPFSGSGSSQTSSQQELPFGLVSLHDQIQPPYEKSTPQIYPVSMPMSDVIPPTTSLPTPPLLAPNLPTKDLTPVWTYSFEESTLGRRLARATAELAFSVLTHLHYPPQVINYAFRLNFPHFTIEQLRERFGQITSKTISDELDWLESPFGYLGGAGSHYPRRDAAGNVIPKKSSWAREQIGPREKRMNGRGNIDGKMAEYLYGTNLDGYEGEWFDPYDVQGYLEEQYACKFNPTSSFAECLVDIEDGGGASVYANIPQQPQENDATNNNTFGLDTSFDNTLGPKYSGDFPKLVDHDISFDQTLGLDLAPGFDYGFASSSGFDAGLGLGVMGEDTQGLQVVKQRKKCVWLDVSRLIQEIVIKAVCLGRTPGFRRKDIDRAVREALIQEH